MGELREFRLLKLTRKLIVNSRDETLPFKKGLNLINGLPNTGKTTWLQIFNFLLGSNRSPEYYFSSSFMQVYQSVSCTISINSELILVERGWAKEDFKTKITYNGDNEVHPKNFQKFLLNKMGIPDLKYPKPDAISKMKATSLSFRMHLRHFYRRQKYWNDLVSNQPPSQFRSVLFNFLGIAEKLYVPQYYSFYEINEDRKIVIEEINKYSFALGSILPMYGIKNYRKDLLATTSNLLAELKEKLNKSNSDIEIGILEERLRILTTFYEKINENLDKKNELSKGMHKHYDYVKNIGRNLEIDKKLKMVAEKMNEYLDCLNKVNVNTWNHGEVRILHNRKTLTFMIGRTNWNAALGGTDSLYFCLAYQYSLLALSHHSEFNIPPFLMIDLPPDIKGEHNNEDDDFIMEPFRQLMEIESHSNCQVIFAGNIMNTELVKPYTLTKIYKS